jgi:alkaline phosphatase D
MRLSRRSFLHGTGPLAFAPFAFGRCGDSEDGEYESRSSPFLHGVASGDPTSDSVILWTRVTRDERAPREVDVRYLVALDPDCKKRVVVGRATTAASRDYTVKIDVTGLEPATTYYYRFEAFGHASVTGRTRTLPRGKVERFRLALTSCANMPQGFFNVYRNIAARADLDLVLMLGDYLYEYANAVFGDGTALGRVPIPDREIVTLEDYRARHAQYKTDRDLQEAHRQHPFICIWDDHEIANDSWRHGAPSNNESVTPWEARRAAAIQAYFEWIPIRRGPFGARVQRQFEIGDLADLTMLDTRAFGRDQQVDGCNTDARNDPSRQLLGAEQEAWFFSRLRQSHAGPRPWHLVGQQVLFGQYMGDAVCVAKPDNWDDYAGARKRVFDFLASEKIDNVVVLTGDIHSSWANDLCPNPFDPESYDPQTGRGSLAVEFATPGVTSPGTLDPVAAEQRRLDVVTRHPHVKFAEYNHRGYVLVDVTRERVQAEWYLVETVLEPSSKETLAAVQAVSYGETHLHANTEPSRPRERVPALAPSTEPEPAPRQSG